MKKKSLYWLSGVSGLLFLLLLALVRTVDVAAIGPEGTSVGLSALNGAVHEATGVSMFWYKLTGVIGYGSIALALCFAVMGLAQFLRRKSLRRVDRPVLALGGLYAAVLALYVFFEHVIVNYRPVLMPDGDGPEASFPSSHTLLACVVLGSAILLLRRYVRDRRRRAVLSAIFAALIALTVVGRLLSGVHWFTDIAASVLLSASLLGLYAAAAGETEARRRK